MNATASWLPRTVALRGTDRVVIYIYWGDLEGGGIGTRGKRG